MRQADGRRHEGNETVARDQARLDLGVLERPDDEAEVDLVLEDLVALGGGGEEGELQPDVGIGEAELTRDVRDQRMAADRRVADAEDRLGAGGEQADGILGDADPSRISCASSRR